MSFQERPRIQEPDIQYLEKFVRFSFAYCSTKNKWCITNLDKNNLEHFYKRMGHFESCTWNVAKGMPREKGISIERKDGNVAYQLLKTQYPRFTTFGHFRVNGTETLTRVFIGLDGDLGYVLIIDRNGELQH